MQRGHLDDLLAFRGSTGVSCGARRATADSGPYSADDKSLL
jgi:hypothetical protein